MIKVIQEIVIIAGVLYVLIKFYRFYTRASEPIRENELLLRELAELVEYSGDEDQSYAAKAIRDCLIQVQKKPWEYSVHQASQVVNKNYIVLERQSIAFAENIRQKCFAFIEFYCKK